MHFLELRLFIIGVKVKEKFGNGIGHNSTWPCVTPFRTTSDIRDC